MNYSISTRVSGCNFLLIIIFRYYFPKKIWKEIKIPHPIANSGHLNNFKLIKHVEFISETSISLHCIFFVKNQEDETNNMKKQENSQNKNSCVPQETEADAEKANAFIEGENKPFDKDDQEVVKTFQRKNQFSGRNYKAVNLSPLIFLGKNQELSQ